MIIQNTDVNENNKLNNSNNEASNTTSTIQNIPSSTSQPLVNIKNIPNSNSINASSTSTLAKSLLANNFNFSNSLQNHLDNINGYDIHFGNFNKSNENQSNSSQQNSTSNVNTNGPIHNENNFVSNNSIYSNVFSSSNPNSSSSIASFLAFNQMQPKSKVNVVNSSFNNIFNNIQFSDLDKNVINKEKESIEVKKKDDDEKIDDTNIVNNDNSNIPESSSKLMFGTLNILNSSNPQNGKGNYYIKNIYIIKNILNNKKYIIILNVINFINFNFF